MTNTRALQFLLAGLVLLATSLIIAGCGSGKASSPPPPAQPPVINSFTASSTTVTPGTAVTLNWNVANATSMTVKDAAGATLATGPLPTGSVQTAALSATTTFTLAATSSGGQVQSAVTVTVSANAPTVVLSATPNPVQQGQFTNLSWTTTNATSLKFDPEIEFEDQNGPPLPNGMVTLALQQTTTYTATVTNSTGATAMATITVTVNAAPPTVSLTTDSQTVLLGDPATLNWNVQAGGGQQITSFVVPGANISAPPDPLPAGSKATPALNTTTTFTGNATQTDGQQATASVTVPVSAIVANPNPVLPHQSTGLRWNFPGATSVKITPCSFMTISDCNALPPTQHDPVPTQPLSKNTTFTATPTGGTTPAASVTVVVSGLQSMIKHIIFFVQENRSFDNYFGKLGDYRASKGLPPEIDQFDPNVKLVGIQGREDSPFHERTVCTDNLSPSWNESHADIHKTSKGFKMDGFLKTTKSIPEGLTRDPNGDRAIGFYDQTDLPYYYELATQFATSDRWFSPLLSHTNPNRMYLFTGTSFGHIRASDPRPDTGWPQPTIFQALNKAGISWRYYYQDSSVFLADFADWNDPKIQGKVVNINAPVLGWFNVLASATADRDLPQVVFIERGSNPPKGSPGLDEHPKNNIQIGAASVKNILDALMNSGAWKSSAFILTFDEGGGLYDHVPPAAMPKPDDIAPILKSSDVVDQFDKTGFRVPFIIVSPWVKPNFVSHTPRDFTAILNLIEERFGLPALTARDAAQASMQEFFDFSPLLPPLIKPPPLPDQPTTGVCDFTLETAP